jgi:tetratricopeptide (TPR) repeat protein
VAAVAVLALALVMLGGAAGWLVQQRAAAEAKAHEALEAAGPGLREGNPWDPALMSAAQRAEALLGSGLLGPQSRSRVEQLHKDVKMLAALERIRLDRGGVRDGLFDLTGWEPQYAPAFWEYGIDMEAPGPEAPVAFLQRSAICEHLVAALDDWAAGLVLVGGDEATAKAKRLLAVARQVDPDPWRNRLRDMVQSREAGELDQLASAAPVEELPRATLGLLGLWVEVAANGLKVLGPPQPVSEPTLEVLRRAQQRFPADFWINHTLASVLTYATPQHLDEAIGFHRAALALRPQSAYTRFYLAETLRRKGKLDGAIAEYRKVIELAPEFAFGHCGLGNALRDKGDMEGAIAAYRKATRFKADYAEPHSHLGNALAARGDADEAIAECRKAIDLEPDFAFGHCCYGNALRAKGDVEGAIAEYRKATDLQPRYAYAHGALGRALLQQGRFAEAQTATRRSLELLPQHDRLRQTASRQLQQCERVVELDGKLPAILSGKEQLHSAAERTEYADVCQKKRLYAAAARLSREAIAAQPDLVASPLNGLRYNAACAAALAGCGAGEDADKLTDAERAGLRQQALDWLRADLDAWRGMLDKEPDKARPAVAHTMRYSLGDPDFNGVRGPDALAKLPEAERKEWQKLWADVADTLARARDVTNQGQPRE